MTQLELVYPTPLHLFHERRGDHEAIAALVSKGASVLDVGCGDGALLDDLVQFKQVDARGMELSQAGVNACVANGLSVIQGDADTDLGDYPDSAFDYVAAHAWTRGG